MDRPDGERKSKGSVDDLFTGDSPFERGIRAEGRAPTLSQGLDPDTLHDVLYSDNFTRGRKYDITES